MAAPIALELYNLRTKGNEQGLTREKNVGRKRRVNPSQTWVVSSLKNKTYIEHNTVGGGALDGCSHGSRAAEPEGGKKKE